MQFLKSAYPDNFLEEKPGDLPAYIKRNAGTPFHNMKPDEKLIAHWALVYKELLKFNYSAFYGLDLDDVSTEQQMKNLTKDKKGGIEWFNYMFSEQYEGKDKKRDKKGKIFAVLSMSEALEKYGATSIGDFMFDNEVLNYVKEARKNGDLPDGHIIRDQKLFEDAKKAAEFLIRADKRMKGHMALSILGACAGECGWKFEGSYMAAEAEGGGANGTGGYTGCGETWFGLTFWNQKCAVINGMKAKGINVPISMNEGSYTKGHMICNLSMEWQAKVTAFYYLDYSGDSVCHKAMKKFAEQQNMANAKDVIGAAFLIKAGEGYGKGAKNLFEGADKAAHVYMDSNSKRFNNKQANIFAKQVYMSMMLAKFLKDKKVPKGDPWDK